MQTKEHTMINDEGLTRAVDRVDAAMTALRSGDPNPYLDCWAKAEDVTLYGAWGPIDHGRQAVSDSLRWVGSRFTGGSSESDYTVVASSGDLAYTVGFERGPASVEGGPTRELVIRVTHIYRRVDGQWTLVHRHGDFPPTDPRHA
jgi:ketosteroid isomerase-like protein